MKNIVIIFLVLALTGCGATTKHYLANDPNAIPVNFSVDLDKDFVKSTSTLGGGQAAMLLLVGPFTNNAVVMEAKEMISIGERTAFQQRLDWGKNEFRTFLEKNKTYYLTVVIQGTRAGAKPIGKIEMKDTLGQHFDVVLHGDGVTVR